MKLTSDGTLSGSNFEMRSVEHASMQSRGQIAPETAPQTTRTAVTSRSETTQPHVVNNHVVIDIPEGAALAACLRQYLAPLYERVQRPEARDMLDRLVEKRVGYLEERGVSVARFDEVITKVRTLDYLTAIVDGGSGSLGFFAGIGAYESKRVNEISQAATSWIGGQIGRDPGRSCANAFVEWMPACLLDRPAGDVRNAWLRRTDKENPYFTRSVGKEDPLVEAALKHLQPAHSTFKKVFQQASAYGLGFQGKAVLMAGVNIGKAFTMNPAVNAIWASASCSVLAGAGSKCIEHKFAEERAEAGVVPFLTRADFEAAFEDANQYDAGKWAKNTAIRVVKAPPRIIAEIPDILGNQFKPSTLLPAGVMVALGGALDAAKFWLTHGMPDGVPKVALSEGLNLLGFGAVVFGWGLVAFSPVDDAGQKIKLMLQCAETGDELELEIVNDAMNSSQPGTTALPSDNATNLHEVTVHFDPEHRAISSTANRPVSTAE